MPPSPGCDEAPRAHQGGVREAEWAAGTHAWESLTGPASVSVEATWGAAGRCPSPPCQGAVCVRTQNPTMGSMKEYSPLLLQRRPGGEPDFCPYPAVMRRCSSFYYQTKVRGHQQKKPAKQEELIKSNLIIPNLSSFQPKISCQTKALKDLT